MISFHNNLISIFLKSYSTIFHPIYAERGQFKFYSFTFHNGEGVIQSFCFIVLVIVESGNLEAPCF